MWFTYKEKYILFGRHDIYILTINTRQIGSTFRFQIIFQLGVTHRMNDYGVECRVFYDS